VTTPNAGIVAVGNVVGRYLERQCFARRFARVIHYSSLAGRARRAGIVGHEERFKQFAGSVSLNDLVATMEHVFNAAHASAELRDEALSQLTGSQLTTSHQELIFNYKVAFEAVRAGR
jgi:hypothetical protein